PANVLNNIRPSNSIMTNGMEDKALNHKPMIEDRQSGGKAVDSAISDISFVRQPIEVSSSICRNNVSSSLLEWTPDELSILNDAATSSSLFSYSVGSHPTELLDDDPTDRFSLFSFSDSFLDLRDQHNLERGLHSNPSFGNENGHGS